MEEMAAMLNEYAGGLQQSFSTVFDRVGQSLAQSAQMMQMMNDVMEAALLQNLRVECAFDPASKELLVTVVNQSQIILGEVALSVHIGGDAASTAAAASAFSHVFESLSPTEQHLVRVPLQTVPVAGHAELTLRSPGTQAPLQKSCPFRVSLFQVADFLPVKREQVVINPLTSAMSAKIDLQQLRGVLRLSPLDAMLTVDTGSYRFAAAATGSACYYLSISRGSGESGAAEVMIAAENSNDGSPDLETLRISCEALLEELEASTK